MVGELTDKNIDSYMKGDKQDKAFLTLFYTKDFPNSENIKAVFHNFDNQLKGKVDVLFCEIYKQPYVNQYFQMQTLPAVLFMKNNKVYGNLAGPASEAKYQDVVKDGLVKLISEQKG